MQLNFIFPPVFKKQQYKKYEYERTMNAISKPQGIR